MNELETLSRLSQLYQVRTMLSSTTHNLTDLTDVNNEICFLESRVSVSSPNEQYGREEERLKKLADEVKIIENGVEHPFGVKE